MKKRSRVLLIALTLLAALVLFVAPSIRAGTTDTASGTLWSSNIGWISLNNCTDPANSSTCEGKDYGVTINPSTGAINGTAWSSNIGWITFDDVGCPNAGCTGGAYVNLLPPRTDGSYTITGWARACSVFASGCSGNLADNAYRGSWDGFLSLSGSGYGLILGGVSGTTRSVTGSIWGSEVIGWLAAVNAKVTIPPATCTNLPNGPHYSVPAGFTLQSDGSTCLSTTGDMCPNIPGTQDAAYLVAQELTYNAQGDCVPKIPQESLCKNHPEFKQSIPLGWSRNADTGNCNYGSCTDDTCKADMCPNIVGTQDAAYMTAHVLVFDQHGQCVTKPGDYCPNIPYTDMKKNGLPSSWSIDGQGNCVPPTEMCQSPYENISRSALPGGWKIDTKNGNCIPPIGEYCPDGTPKPANGICSGGKRCPDGSQPVNNSCGDGNGTSSSTDVCPNIIGIQLAAPAGYTINSSNQCVPFGYPELENDWCPNISGVQSAIPIGMTVDMQGSCIDPKKPIFREF